MKKRTAFHRFFSGMLVILVLFGAGSSATLLQATDKMVSAAAPSSGLNAVTTNHVLVIPAAEFRHDGYFPNAGFFTFFGGYWRGATESPCFRRRSTFRGLQLSIRYLLPSTIMMILKTFGCHCIGWIITLVMCSQLLHYSVQALPPHWLALPILLLARKVKSAILSIVTIWAPAYRLCSIGYTMCGSGIVITKPTCQ